MNANSLTLKGCHVPLTAFYRLVKVLLNANISCGRDFGKPWKGIACLTGNKIKKP